MESSSQSSEPRRLELAGVSWPAILLLLLTAGLSLVWSHYRLMDQDEFLALWTDSVSSIGQLIQIQRTCPISLDPLFYHVLAHFSIRIFGAGAFAIRLPSLLGYLLMQGCLYKFVRRFALEGAAIFALAFPALTATFFYSVEGRPYGLLLGLYALAMVSWQTAIRCESQRTGALITLALAVALTLNTHYFGILLLAPLCTAELYRTVQRRRLDFPVIAAIAVGTAAFIFTLPFMKAADVYRKHYYNVGEVDYHAITQAYRALLVDYTDDSMRMQHALAVLFVLLTGLFLWGCIRQLRSRSIPLANAETVFLIVLAALPIFGYLLARYVTHSIEVRYVLGAIIAIAVLLAITLAPLFSHQGATRVILASLVVAIVISGALRIGTARRDRQQTIASLAPTPEIKQAVLSSPTHLLYIQALGEYAVASYYMPDPDLRAHLALLYSSEEELRWRFRDTNALTAINMQTFSPLTIVPYESLTAQPGDHIFLLYHDGWSWTDSAFAADHAEVVPRGKMLQGDVAAVRFHP